MCNMKSDQSSFTADTCQVYLYGGRFLLKYLRRPHFIYTNIIYKCNLFCKYDFFYLMSLLLISSVLKFVGLCITFVFVYFYNCLSYLCVYVSQS